MVYLKPVIAPSGFDNLWNRSAWRVRFLRDSPCKEGKSASVRFQSTQVQGLPLWAIHGYNRCDGRVWGGLHHLNIPADGQGIVRDQRRSHIPTDGYLSVHIRPHRRRSSYSLRTQVDYHNGHGSGGCCALQYVSDHQHLQPRLLPLSRPCRLWRWGWAGDQPGYKHGLDEHTLAESWFRIWGQQYR